MHLRYGRGKTRKNEAVSRFFALRRLGMAKRTSQTRLRRPGTPMALLFLRLRALGAWFFSPKRRSAVAGAKPSPQTCRSTVAGAECFSVFLRSGTGFSRQTRRSAGKRGCAQKQNPLYRLAVEGAQGGCSGGGRGDHSSFFFLGRRLAFKTFLRMRTLLGVISTHSSSEIHWMAFSRSMRRGGQGRGRHLCRRSGCW